MHPPRRKKDVKEYTGYNMPPAQAERIENDLRKGSEQKSTSQSGKTSKKKESGRRKDQFEK